MSSRYFRLHAMCKSVYFFFFFSQFLIWSRDSRLYVGNVRMCMRAIKPPSPVFPFLFHRTMNEIYANWIFHICKSLILFLPHRSCNTFFGWCVCVCLSNWNTAKWRVSCSKISPKQPRYECVTQTIPKAIRIVRAHQEGQHTHVPPAKKCSQETTTECNKM